VMFPREFWCDEKGCIWVCAVYRFLTKQLGNELSFSFASQNSIRDTHFIELAHILENHDRTTFRRYGVDNSFVTLVRSFLSVGDMGWSILCTQCSDVHRCTSYIVVIRCLWTLRDRSHLSTSNSAKQWIVQSIKWKKWIFSAPLEHIHFSH
jgi:hypothetical protein